MGDSFRLGSDGIYRCQAFQQFSWQSHGFGTRNANPIAAVTLRQVHSNVILNSHNLKDREREGDGLLTNEVGLAIGVRTADCVPILLLDIDNRSVAAVHAGWRGTAAEIVGCAIHKMSSEFQSKAQDISAAVGPCIRECCYEVGSDVAAEFQLAFPEWAQSPAKPNGKRNLDLAQANIRQMVAAGVSRSQIFDSCACTCCQREMFYSFRREPGETGRMMSAITRIS